VPQVKSRRFTTPSMDRAGDFEKGLAVGRTSSVRPYPRVLSGHLPAPIGRLRDELLNETLFASLAHARAALAEWRLDYNTVRPHSSLGNLPPVGYAKLGGPASQRDGTGRCAQSGASRPVPLQHRACKTQMANRLYPSVDDKRGSDHNDSRDASCCALTWIKSATKIPAGVEHRIVSAAEPDEIIAFGGGRRRGRAPEE
jgi:Integrase core domain